MRVRRPPCPAVPTLVTGVTMKFLRWAIALAAIGLTPAAATAQAPASAPAPAAATTPAQAQPAAPAPGAEAQSPGQPAATPPAVDHGGVGHMMPTPGIGVPDGRKGIQMQVTPIGREAQAFHDYWLLTLCAIISIIVLGLLLWAMIRYRRSANPTPSRNSHNTLIEVLWTVIPVLILVAIAIPSIRLLRHQYTPPPADVTVKVIGHQWYWTYELPDYGITFDSHMLKEAYDPTRQPNQRPRKDADGPPLLAVDNRLVIPVGKVVKFIVTADDVIHSFAVPAFWVKQDANPGQLHETWAKVDRPGVYFGMCSELCGARHAYMPVAVEAVPQAQFERWVASRGGTMPGARPGPTAPPGHTGVPALVPAAAAPTAGPEPVVQQPATNQAATAQN